MNPKAGHVTLQSVSALWTLFLKASVAWRFTHTHHETQVQLPSWSTFPPPSLFPHPPSEEHMSPITVLLSQHTIKAECQILLLGPFLSSHSIASYDKLSLKQKCFVQVIFKLLRHGFSKMDSVIIFKTHEYDRHENNT